VKPNTFAAFSRQPSVLKKPHRKREIYFARNAEIVSSY